MPLYIRLSEYTMAIARYELRTPPAFSFATFRLRPQASFTMNLREACDTEPLLQGPAPNAQIIVCGPVTPVPLAEFQEEESEAIYNFCFPSEQRRRVFYDTLPRANAVLLFAMDEMQCAKLEEAFPDARFLSSQTALLRHFSTKDATRPAVRIFIHLYENVMELSAFEENRLLVCNRFQVHDATDVAYYTLNIARQLAFEPEESPIYVAGDTPVRDAAITELGRYVRHVHFIQPTGEYNRHIVTTTPGVPYDMMTLLAD